MVSFKEQSNAAQMLHRSATCDLTLFYDALVACSGIGTSMVKVRYITLCLLLIHVRSTFALFLTVVDVWLFGLTSPLFQDNKTEQERVMNHMLKVNLSVVKERDAATQALQKLATKRSDAELPSGGPAGSAPGGAPASAKKSSVSLSSVFKSNANPQKSFEKQKEASIKACESYAACLQAANLNAAKYHSEDLPSMLTQMQSLEEMRLHSLNTALKDFSRLQKSFTGSMLELSQVVESLAKKMNANDDIAGFVREVCLEHGPALAPIPFTYDIPISLAELKAMTYDEPPSSLFYSTLDGVIKQQKSLEQVQGTTANALSNGLTVCGVSRAALDLPLIVPTLLRHIVAADGQHSEGIFRISVGSEELTRLRRQLEAGDFTLAGQSNPHVSACILKSWFRDLLQPVVPFASYQAAIAMGQLEPFSSQNAAQVQQMRNVLADLPPLNARILATLFGFLKRLSSEPAWVAKTRMNLANLSLVFSPGLVRSEKNDPMQMLQGQQGGRRAGKEQCKTAYSEKQKHIATGGSYIAFELTFWLCCAVLLLFLYACQTPSTRRTSSCAP
jgi:hypothetical protein